MWKSLKDNSTGGKKRKKERSLLAWPSCYTENSKTQTFLFTSKIDSGISFTMAYDR